MAMAPQHIQLLQSFRKVIPPLLFDTHKGEAGRIGVVGGSEEYTGAPIFASMAAFRTGADLVHVFCAKNAAIPIKSFSPDLIDSKSFSDDIGKWLPRLHALVIGPGLGRDENILSNVEQLIGILRKQEQPIPIVIDADGLYLITEKPHLINNYENCILTPNIIEFERLYEKVSGAKSEEIKKEDDKKKLVQKLAEALHVNVLMKGHLDTISSPNNQEPIQCGIEGSPRRCGGQGDLLAGALAVSYYWAIKSRDKFEYQASNSEKSSITNERPHYSLKLTPAQVAAYAASTLVRTASQAVFNKLGRAMISADVLKEIGPTNKPAIYFKSLVIFKMNKPNIYAFPQPILTEEPSTLLGTIRNFVSNIIAPFQQEYRYWPWTKIGTVIVVCVGSYTLYKYLPGPYRRYYMSSTKNFSLRYNKALHLEKEKLFDELKYVKIREEGRRLQVVEIGAAHGANMQYYPPHLVEVICVEPMREFEKYLTQTLRQNPNVQCRELLVGSAENISVIRDNQVDAVVSTLTLSCCKNIDQTLREIRRILKPGGVFLYMENIRSPNIFFAAIQYLCSPIYKLLFGISLTRNIPEHIERAHFNGGITQHIFIAHGIPFLLSPHVSGIARK
ncbi:unnamed protein product [Rotaria sp. Silwood1]|nr:unnamed protein product [Rotaria sp. Silwood1]CAF0956828.1 unnamed protein product [Rotaria sp. Silwood1]